MSELRDALQKIERLIPNGPLPTDRMNGHRDGLIMARNIVVKAAVKDAEGGDAFWERLAGYLIEECEGQIISEESIQGWASDLLKSEPSLYTRPQASAAVPEGFVLVKLTEISHGVLVAPEFSRLSNKAICETYSAGQRERYSTKTARHIAGLRSVECAAMLAASQPEVKS